MVGSDERSSYRKCPWNSSTHEEKNLQIRHHPVPLSGVSVTFYDGVCHGPVTNIVNVFCFICGRVPSERSLSTTSQSNVYQRVM